jgi:steroid 5-alpha reductase family enzyme
MILIFSILQYIENGFSLKIIGVLNISAKVVIFYAGLFIKPQARTSATLKIYSIAMGFFICTLALLLTENKNLLHPALCLALATGWMLYLKWYWIFKKRKNEGLKVRNQLEKFTFENSKKESISSTSFLRKHSIFLFYRGNWYPLCMAKIKEIARQYDELDKLGVHTILISP